MQPEFYKMLLVAMLLMTYCGTTGLGNNLTTDDTIIT